MQTNSQVALECKASLPSENLLIKKGDSGFTLFSPSVVSSQQPVKKQTRQWAAWTRQEEESFFNALRQVGKNFQKITFRVQTKNKDQVRHYYYRLVKRMNKLLGPEFSLDAKNSKDTNAAMLRWWSLLEKYSCKASKLHLKPRRFKIFIEALEHQLLKDRKKNIRKRPSLGENCLPASPTTVPFHSKASGQDTCSVNLVIVDSQNVQKVGSGKGSSLKRNVYMGISRSNNKDNSSTLRRQRRKTGAASSAAHKRWEKAAIAGVSLVADAAEHLERTTTTNKAFSNQETFDESFPRLGVTPNGNKDIDSVVRILPLLPVSTCSQHQVKETSAQASMKLKLQLFPIDEGTRRALEKDEHNPHLELTLSARKKIASVVEHLNRKWGNSSIASGKLILFPYSVQRENIGDNQRWTQDTNASAADVYAIIGSPPVFRLRYGWFSSTELKSVAIQSPSTSLHIQEELTSVNISNRKDQDVDATPILPTLTHHQSEQLPECSRDQLIPMKESTSLLTSCTDLSEDMIGHAVKGLENNFQVPSFNASWLGKEIGNETIRRRLEDLDNPRESNNTAVSAGEWADSLTNISIGDLLSEASCAMDTNCINPPAEGSSQYLHQIPFSCDSFDAAIAAHITDHLERPGLLSAQVSHSSSILDADETCDAFSFQKISALKREAPSPSGGASSGACEQIATSMSFGGLVEELPEAQQLDDIPCKGNLIENCQRITHGPDNFAKALSPDNSQKDVCMLTDIYWPDSLGPLDLDIPSSRYRSQDLIIGDSISLSGLHRLIASSLDAFQNCPFFGLDKKEPSTGEA